MNYNKLFGLCDAILTLLTLLIQSTWWAFHIFKSMLSYNYIPNYLMELNFYNNIAQHLFPLIKICQYLAIALHYPRVSVISWTVSCYQ